MNAFELKRVVEAVLFVSDKPLTVKEIWQKLFLNPNSDPESETPAQSPESSEAAQQDDDDLADSDRSLSLGNLDSEVSKNDIYRVVCELQQEYENRGCQLKEVASGFRFQVSEDMSVWLQRWRAEKPPRYSRAVLETLAIIAYKQPITRAEIEDIRGVAVSSHIVKGLLEREWVRIVGHKEVPGRPALLATTRSFLDYFNVSSLDQLPTLAEIKELGQQIELEPQSPPEPSSNPASEAKEDAPLQAESLAKEEDMQAVKTSHASDSCEPEALSDPSPQTFGTSTQNTDSEDGLFGTSTVSSIFETITDATDTMDDSDTLPIARAGTLEVGKQDVGKQEEDEHIEKAQDSMASTEDA